MLVKWLNLSSADINTKGRLVLPAVPFVHCQWGLGWSVGFFVLIAAHIYINRPIAFAWNIDDTVIAVDVVFAGIDAIGVADIDAGRVRFQMIIIIVGVLKERIVADVVGSIRVAYVLVI